MTTIGLRGPAALVPPVKPAAEGRPLEDAVPTAVSRVLAPPPVTWVRVGKVSARSAMRYFAAWAGVLFVVQLVVLTAAYVVLGLLGVTGSVSRALAVINNSPLPASGVMPLLQPQHLLPLLVLVSLVMSLLFLVVVAGLVLVHNATTTLTGGLTVRVRPDPRGKRRP